MQKEFMLQLASLGHSGTIGGAELPSDFASNAWGVRFVGVVAILIAF